MLIPRIAHHPRTALVLLPLTASILPRLAWAQATEESKATAVR